MNEAREMNAYRTPLPLPRTSLLGMVLLTSARSSEAVVLLIRCTGSLSLLFTHFSTDRATNGAQCQVGGLNCPEVSYNTSVHGESKCARRRLVSDQGNLPGLATPSVVTNIDSPSDDMDYTLRFKTRLWPVSTMIRIRTYTHC